METHTVSVLCVLLVMLAIRVDSQSTEEETDLSEAFFPESHWDVEWNATGPEGSVSIGGAFEPFAVAGEVVPGLETSTLIDVAANSWRSDSLRQAAGEICRSLGPVASQFLGSRVQEVCKPILDSLSTGNQIPELSGVCEGIVREIEDQLSSDDEGSDGGSNVGSTDHLPENEDDAGEESGNRTGSEGGVDGESVDEWPGSEGGSDNESGDRLPGSEGGMGGDNGDRWPGSEGGSDKEIGSEIDFGTEFWYTPDYGYFYPSEFLKEILGFAGNSQTETCRKLGSIVYNRSLTGRDILRNITSAAVRHLLPLSLQFCDRANNSVHVTFGKVLLELFSTLTTDQDVICGEPEHFNERVNRITDYLLGDFLYNDQACREVFSRLENLGIRANLGFGYDSVDSMCLSIQQIAYMSETSEERERDDLSEAGLVFRRVLRAVAGFLHSGSVREGFLSLCNTFQESSSPADYAMCAALDTDNSRELIRQCLSLCGANEDESLESHDSDNDYDGPRHSSPWEDKFDELFGWVGELSGAVGRIPGLEDYDLVGIITDVLGYGFSSDIQSACEVTENKLFYSEDVSVRQLVNAAMDVALQKLIYASPSLCGWESRPSESAASDRYEDSFVTIYPSDESDESVTEANGDLPWIREEATERPSSYDGVQPSAERYDKPSWYGDSNEDGSVNLDILGTAFAFFADVQSPDALCNKSIEVVSSANLTKLEQFANKTKDGIMKVITDEQTCVRFLSVMSDKFGGLDLLGGLLSGFESAEQLCFVLTIRLDWEDEQREQSTSAPRQDVSMTEQPEGPREEQTRQPNSEREDHLTDSGVPNLLSLFGRLVKSPSVRQSFEEVCNFFEGDLTDEERESCFAVRSGDPDKYFESCLKLENIFFQQEDGGDGKFWMSPTDIATYMRFINEWVQLSMNGADELQAIIEKAHKLMFNRDVPFPDFSDFLMDVLDLQDPNLDTVCERVGYIVHGSNMTVRDVAIKMLDSLLVSIGRYVDNLCYEPSRRYPLYELSYSDVTGSPSSADADYESRRERPFTESPSFQSNFDTTDDPPWLSSYKEGEWKHDGKDPFSGRLGGKIFAYLGNFKSPEEICGRHDEEGSGEYGSGESGRKEAVSEVYDRMDRPSPIADRVVAMRRKLMSVTQNIDVCVGLLEVVTSELDIFSGVIPGFTDPYSFCQKIKYSFASRNRGSLSDSTFNDFTNPAEDMAGLLTIAGHLFNSEIKEALLFPCKLFSDTPLAMLVSSECGVLSHSDPSPLIKQCKGVMVEFMGDDYGDNWYLDGILPSFWGSDDDSSPFGWFGKFMEGMFPVDDLSVLFYDMFGLEADSPGELCSNAESFVSNESMTMQIIFDMGLDASLRYMIRASPKICQNEGTAGPTEIPTFDPNEVPSWAESFMENMYLNIPGVDPFDAMKAAFTFLGHYNSSDEFCQDALEAMAAYAEPALLDDVINGMKVVVYTLIEDADACETYLDVIQEELSLPFTLGNISGHADNPSLCRAVVDAFNPEARTNRSIPTFAKWKVLSNLAENIEDGLISLNTEALNLVGHLYNAGTFRDVVNETCSYLKESDEVRELSGQRFGRLCEWATTEHDALKFYEICFAIATTQSWDIYSSVEEESEFDSFGFGGYSKIGEFIINFGTELFSVEKTLYWLQEMFGVDVSSPEQVCGSAKQLIANDSLTVPVIFNSTLEIFARHAAKASPWLCRSEMEATAVPTGAPGSEASEPSWAESVFESVYLNVPGVDPQEFMKVVFSYLSRYDMSDAFCRDTMSAVAEGADPALLEGLVNKTKDSIYILVKDADSCESFMGVIQESLELPYSIGEVVGLGDNRGFCEGLTVAFGSASGRNATSGNDEFRLGQLFDFAAHVDSTGGIRSTLRSGCDVLDLFDIVPDELKTGYTIACAWSRMASNAEIFYHVCLDFVSESLKGEEEDNKELDNGWWPNAYIPDWMRDISGSFGNSIYTHTDTLLWMQKILGLDAESPDRFCETARERIEDESNQIRDVVDSSLDIFLHQLTGVYPWLCTLEVDTTMEPTGTEAPGVDLSEMPPWADSVMEKVYLEIPGVVPEELLGVVLGYLGRYNFSETLCRDSIEAVEDYGKLHDMITTMKATLYNMLEDSHSCEFFTDVLQESLELPFAIGNVTGFDSNREFCEAIGSAFRSDNYDEVSLFALRQFFEGDDLSDEQKPFYDLIKFLGRLFNSGSVRNTLCTGCDLFEQANFFPDMFESEARSACDWVRYGLEPEVFQRGCVSVITTPIDGDSEEPGVFDWIGELFGIFSIEKTFFWLQEIFGIDASSPEKVCGSAKELIANESLTVPVIIDTTMDIFIRHAVHASPWLCQGESETTGATTGAPGFESTDMPSWAEEAMADIYMRVPGLDPLEVGKVVYSFLGGYNSSNELCMNSIEAIAEGADPALLDELVIRTKESLYTIMKDVNSCEHFMDVIHESAGIPSSLADLIGVSSNRELCEVFSTVFASEGDSSFGDWGTDQPREEPNLGKLFDIAGQLDSSGTLMEMIRTGCDVLDQLDIVPEQVKSGMAITCAWSRMGSKADIFYAACITYVSQAEDDVEDDSWWTATEIPDWQQNTLGDYWNDVFSFSYSDIIMWMQSQFGLDISSPEQVCNNAKYFMDEESLSPTASLDAALDFVIRQFASASPWLCMNEPDSTAVPEESSSEPKATEMPRESSGFNTSEIPPWAYAAYSNLYMDMLGVDPLTLTGDVFSFLGRYDNSNQLCRDTLEAVADNAEPALLDDMVNRMKQTVYSLMRDADSCESFMDIVGGSLNLPLSLGELIGLSGNREICEAAAASVDNESRMDLDLSTLMRDEEHSPNFVLLQIFVRFLNSRNMKDTLLGTCSVLDQFSMIDQLGAEFRVVCEWAKIDSTVEIFYYACLDFVRPSYEDHGTSVGPATQIFNWIMDMSDEFGSNTDMLYWMLNLFGFDVSAEEVCDGVNDVFKGESFNIPEIVDTLAEIYIRSTAYASPWLCNDFHDFLSTEKPSWYDMEEIRTPSDMEENRSEREYDQEYGRSDEEIDEELDFVGALFTFLGRYDNSRQLCRDSLEAVAVGADPDLLNKMVRTMKDTLYSLMKDARSCNSFVDLIQRSMGVPFPIGQIIGFESNFGYCKAIQDAFDPRIDNDIDFSAFLILLPAELRLEMGRYDEEMDRNSEGMDRYDNELTTRSLDDGWRDSYRERTTRRFDDGQMDSYSEETTRGYDEESGWDRSEFTTDSYYRPSLWRGDREDHGAMVSPEEHFFIRELIKLNGRLFKSGTIKEIVSMSCDFIDQTYLNLDVLGNGFGEVCKFSRLDSDSNEIYFTCLEFFKETGSNNPDECTDGWWTSLLFTGPVDFGPSPTDDGPGTDGENKPWWYKLLLLDGSDLPYQLDELMNSFDGHLFSYDDVTKWMEYIFRLDSSSAEQVCSSALYSIQDETLTFHVIADNAMDIFIRQVAYASPQLCSEVLEEKYESAPGSYQFFPTEMPPSEASPRYLLEIVFTFLGGYENTFQLCQESVQAVQDDTESLDRLVQTMKGSILNLIEDANSCELFLGVMQSSVGLPVSIGEIVGLESSRQLCESVAAAFSPNAMADIDLSAVLTLLSPSDMMSYSGPDTEEDQRTANGIADQFAFGELIKIAGKLYNSGSIMDMLSSACDLLDQANVAPETIGSKVDIVCALLRTEQSLSDTILPLCVSEIGPAFDGETDDEQLEDWFENLFSSDFVMSLIQKSLLIDSSSPENFCSGQVGNADDDTATVRSAFETFVQRYIRMIADAAPQLCSEDGNTKTDEGRRVVGTVFTVLGLFADSDELCQTTLTALEAEAYESEKENSTQIDVLIGRFVDSLYSVKGDLQSCETFLAEIGESLSLPSSVSEQLGVGTDRALCEAIVEAFDPMSNVDVDISQFLPLILSVANGNGLPDVTNLPLLELIRTAGHFINAGNIQSVVRESCNVFIDQFADSLSYVEFDFHSLCDWSRSDSDPTEFYDTCLGWFPTDGEEPNNPGTDVSFDFSLLSSLQELASRELGLSLYDPYPICSTFGETLDTTTSDLMERILVRPFFVSIFADGNLLSKCMTYTRNISLFGETYSYTPEGFGNFTDIEQVFANLAGTFSNGSQFCKFVVDISDDGDMQDAAVTTALESAFNIMNDVSLCNSTAHLLLTNVSNDIFRLITGVSKANIPTLCTYLYDSFNGDVDPFDLQLPDGFTIEGYVPAVEGELLPGVSFRDMVNLVGKIISTDTFKESLVVTCNSLGPLLDDAVYEGLGDLVPLCEALRGGENSVVVNECEKVLVPLMYGSDYPLALRPVDIGQLIMDTVFPLFNLQIEDENYCPGVDAVLNSDLTPQQLVVSLMDSWLKIGMEYGSGICESREEVFDYLVPDLSWIDPPSGDFYEEVLAEKQRFVQSWHSTFDLASELTGFDSADEMCSALIAASGDANVTNALVDAIGELILTYLTDEAECKAALGSLARFINILDLDISNVFYQVTGYFSPQALCIVSTAAFRGEADTSSDTCFGIVDCAGVCNGDAEYDCAGFCLGTSVRDCAGVCNGQATINSCNECVGGITRRQQDFGKDRCGICWSDPSYRITWDCAGTCNGTAFVDDCNECVGGETGKPEDYNDFRIDCKGFCDGSWLEDGCGYCEPITQLSTSLSFSKYMDCAGNCFTPGVNSDRAQLNQCGVCYGGTTGLLESSGTNACGQCESDANADESSCAGCDGVPNSGKTLDACGECGGSGTTCFGVGWIVPSVVSDGSDTELQVYGAGFDFDSTFACIFENSEGAQTSSSAVYVDYVNLQCNVPGLASGDYLVKVQKDSSISTNEFSTTLTVLPVIEVLTVLPSELTISSLEATFDVTVTASESAFTAVKSFATPYLILEGDVNIVPTGTFDTESDSIMYFTLPMPSSSIQVTAWPSLNGIDRLTASDGEGFPFTAYYPAPEFTEVYFASSGAALVARFSSGVNFNEITGCGDVFADTSKFGDNAFCRWVGSTTLYVILGTGNDLAAVGDVLALKDDSVKAFRETYSLSASGSQAIGGPSTPIVPTVVLYGTPMITSCGTVRLSGRQSQGGAGRDMVYTWGVSSSGDTSSLEALLADETRVNLVAQGALLDADTVYTFSLTAENFLGESDTAYFNVSRSSQAVPEVTILAKGVDPEQVYVSDSFDLTAEVTFYTDCVPPGETVFSWSVNNDNVPLNLKTINRRTLHVDSNSLPGDSSITFTITIYKSSEPNNSVSQSFTVQTVYSDLVAIIYGGSELTVGRDSGLFVLDGSGSFDLDQVAVDMTYEWQCSQVTDSTACWSFKSGEGGTQFPTSAAAAMSLLSLDGSSMEADKTYEFTLVVSKQTRTASTSVMVTALNGNPPKVDIASVTGRVKADKSLSLTASIYHDLPLSSYVWETVGDDLGYSYLDLTDSSNLDSEIGLYSLGSTNGSFTVLSIKSGKLTAGSTYVIQLTATTEDMQYGIAKVQFTVLGEVTSCIFSLDGIDSYTELDSIAYTIDNCVGDQSAYPLSYRVFLLDESKLQTITEKTNDPSITGVGKPLLGDSQSNTFVAEVCDTLKSCAYFYHTVNVTANLECTVEDAASLTESLVTVEKFKQNFGGALINYNTIQQKCSNATSARRRRRSVVDTSSDAAIEQLSLVTEVIDNTVLDVDSAQFLLDQCSYINTDELTVADQSTFIDIFVTLLAVFESAGESVPEDSAAIIVNKAIEIRRGLNATHNAATLSSITNLIDSLSQAQVSDLSLGAAALETISSALTSSVQRAIPSGVFSSKSSGGNTVDFGTALGDIFNAAWACSSGTCSGVTVNFEHWATGEDDFSVSAEDRTNVAADITDIKLLDPSSGEELSIENLTELISITLSVTQPQTGKSYECRYWDTDTSTWATDGLETVIDSSDDTQVECLTDHLTAFTLIAVEGATAMPTEMDTFYPDDATTIADATTPAVVTDPIELPTEESSTTVIIVVVVVVVVVVLLLVIIAVVVVLKGKKGIKHNAVDPNGNIPLSQMEEAHPVEEMQVPDDLWAAAPQRLATPRRTPEPPVQRTSTTVQVVAVPVALETANIESLSSPPSPHLVADMNDIEPPPVYLPPSQKNDTTVHMTQVA